MKVLSENAQWFEDNSTIYENHKKKNISGVSYKVVNVASESGDSSPSTPIGVNLLMLIGYDQLMVLNQLVLEI